jgi:hypothetical protein
LITSRLIERLIARRTRTSLYGSSWVFIQSEFGHQSRYPNGDSLPVWVVTSGFWARILPITEERMSSAESNSLFTMRWATVSIDTPVMLAMMMRFTAGSAIRPAATAHQSGR